MDIEALEEILDYYFVRRSNVVEQVVHYDAVDVVAPAVEGEYKVLYVEPIRLNTLVEFTDENSNVISPIEILIPPPIEIRYHEAFIIAAEIDIAAEIEPLTIP